MPLMPLPPMPTKWMVLIRRMRSRRSGVTRRSTLTRSGKVRRSPLMQPSARAPGTRRRAHPRRAAWRAGAADHQVRPAVRLAHVLDERTHIRAHPRLGIAGAPGVDPALAGLVTHVEDE